MDEELDLRAAADAMDRALDIPWTNLALVQDFVEQIGGIERARIALEALDKIQRAA